MDTATGLATVHALHHLASLSVVREPQAGDAVDGQLPLCVAAPGSAAEAAALLQWASRAGVGVIPRGGGTALAWGAPPSGPFVLLDTTRLNRVLEHAAGDLVVRVEAGCTLHALQDTLARAGHMLAVDANHLAGTVGGAIATNASGYRRLRYGSVRDLLIGITVVLSDGTTARAGGRVVKNVAGYDLCKLFAGSFGTLGLIVEAIFRLHPRPAARRTIVLESIPSAAASPAARAVRQSSLAPSALDVYGQGGRYDLGILFEGSAAGVAAQAAAALDLLSAHGSVSTLDGAEESCLWDAPPWPDDAALVLKISAVLDDLSLVLEAVEDAAARPGIAPHIRAHAGSGITYVSVPVPIGDANQAVRLIQELRERIVPRGGSVVVCQAPTEVKRLVDVWGPVGDALPLMRRVKAQFDPSRTLNPGRFAGGI